MTQQLAQHHQSRLLWPGQYLKYRQGTENASYKSTDLFLQGYQRKQLNPFVQVDEAIVQLHLTAELHLYVLLDFLQER